LRFFIFLDKLALKDNLALKTTFCWPHECF